MRRCFVFCVVGFVALLPIRGYADWPAYRHDNQRSGYTSEPFAAPSLEESWTHKSALPPQPAWPGPARWDSYANVRGLGSMRNYDPCYHVVVAGDRLYFGSSSDDSVRAVDVNTGSVIWTFTTDGPVRIAPAVAGDHVYFSSDDGCAYCVTAATGKFVWKSDRVDDADLILNNGRFVSLSPCRTGVLIDGNRAVFAQGMLPWRNTILSCVNRLTGKPEGDGTFISPHFGLTLEGALLANDSHIVAPAGRVAPIIFTRANGKHEGIVDGSGGSSVVLTDAGRLLCGPGNKTGWITETDISSRRQTNVHTGPVVTAVTPERRVMASRTRLMAFDVDGRSKQWDVPCHTHNELIIAGNTIVLGGNDVVAGHDIVDGRRLWEVPVDGAAFGLAFANGRLFASTDTGVIHCFVPNTNSKNSVATPDQLPRDGESSVGNDSRDTDAVDAAEQEEDLRGLRGHWVVHRQMSAAARRRGAADGERRVSDLTGTAHALISGEVHIREVGGVEAVELDGETNSLLVSDDLEKAPLPREELSAEVWVRVDESDSRGAIIGCFHDTKEEKAGWTLGFHHQRFLFALAAEEGSRGLTTISGTTVLRPGHWYHVAATYDGGMMRLFVNGAEEASSERQLGAIVYPKQGYYEIGSRHFAESNHPMYGMFHEARVYDRAVSEEELQRRYADKGGQFNVPIELHTGPYAQFVSSDSARIRWKTATPMPTRLVLLEGDSSRRYDNKAATQSHDVVVDGLPRDRMLRYVIEKEDNGHVSQSLEFELDTHFNFSTPNVTSSESPFADSDQQTAAAARHILQECRFERGVCLVLGIGNGTLAWELAQQSDLRIIGVDTDRDHIDSARTRLLDTGMYGARIALHHVDSYDDLPFVGRFANLIVSQQPLTGDIQGLDANELFRVLRPHGGFVCLGHTADTDSAFDTDRTTDWLASTGLQAQATTLDGAWVTATRPALDGAGEWSHLYGQADNSAFGGEELGGASTTSEMDVQWIGRPGPRAQPDRNGRKPSPLSTGGRLFVQGLHRIIALDSFNGTVLWALEIPSLERFNMPRDCSNWCADDDFVYIAARNQCWQIEAATGQIIQHHSVHEASRQDWNWDWGYIAQADDLLIGSAVKAGTAFRSFWGDAGAGWYDARSGPATFKVCSDAVFATDKSSGQKTWSYENGVVINSTITVADGKLYFVESRNADVKESQPRRVGSKELWSDQHLVALDLASGELVWEEPLDTADGTVAFYLASGAGKLVINASTNRQFEVSAYSASNGASEWTQTFDWFERKGDHGKAIQRPAIVNGHVYVRPTVLDLASGEILPLKMPDGKCGTYAATTQALVFRTRQITMWNTMSGSASSWDRMRPGCWLSTIPAAGMLLSPEGGGGCSCGSWMEMSVGFMPRDARAESRQSPE